MASSSKTEARARYAGDIALLSDLELRRLIRLLRFLLRDLAPLAYLAGATSPAPFSLPLLFSH
jgi:hypothetical protein